MQQRFPLLVGLAILLVSQGPALAAEQFETASVRFEQNATDGDVEVVFEVTGPDDGLTKLTIVAPDGRKVVDFTAPDASQFGIREFVFESPEPRDVKSLQAAFPAGEYKFDGANAGGHEFQGTATLNHELPPTVSFMYPGKGAQGVKIDDLEITWTPAANVTGYVIELEQPKLKIKLKSEQPASLSKLVVPQGLLVPGAKYQLGIGTVSADGNVSFVETSFTTAGRD